MTLNRDEIARRLPHAGAMILLDRVTDWNETTLAAESDAPCRADHPFLRDGRLGVAWLIETGAQAMAVHGYLLANPDEPPRRGYLAALKKVTFASDNVTGDDAPLTVQVTLRMGDDRSSLYHFDITGARGPLAEGEAMVTLAEAS